MARAIRAVMFDLGDTLIHFGDVDRAQLFERASRRTYRLWAGRYDRMPDFRRYYLHQWFAMHWGFFKQVILRREMDAEHYIRRACRKLWLRAEDDFFRQLVHEWYTPLKEVATLDPALHDVLRELQGRGLKLGIISNTFVPGYALDEHLEENGLLQYFPHRIYSCDVGYRKPNARIFDQALERIDCLPAEVVFVGDKRHADVAGAEHAGLHAVWLRPDGIGPEESRKHYSISRMTELPELVTFLDHMMNADLHVA